MICFVLGIRTPSNNCQGVSGLTSHVLILVILSSLAVSAGAVMSEEQALSLVQARLQSLQNISFQFEKADTRSPPPSILKLNGKKLKNGSTLRVYSGTDNFSGSLSLLDGMVKMTSELKPDDAARFRATKRAGYSKLIWVIRPDRAERFQESNSTGKMKGLISSETELPSDGVDVGLGLRKYGHGEWISDLDISENTDVVVGERLIEMSRTDVSGRRHVWFHDVGKAAAVTRYEVRVPPGDELNIEYVMDDFEIVDGIFLPGKVISRVHALVNSEKVVTQEAVYEVSEYRLNDSQNTAARYEIVWPDGTSLIDNRIGVMF